MTPPADTKRVATRPGRRGGDGSDFAAATVADSADGSMRRFDLDGVIERHAGRNQALHAAHVNPQFARVLGTIGFDRAYVRGEGAYLWDADGRRYLDMLAGYGVYAVGRNHPFIADALRAYLNRREASLVQMGAPLLSGLLAAELKSRMPNALDLVYFTSTGAECVETALKFARRATRRRVVVVAGKSYHGLTNGALPLAGDSLFREGMGASDAHVRRVPFGDVSALEAALRSGDVAAFVLEPIQGKSVAVASDDYLLRAGELCRASGAKFVVDEVQCGMHRSGSFVACAHAPGVDPDMVLLSKALSGGLVPVGAVVMRRAVYDAVFDSMERAVVHSSTFGQGDLAMVAGLATLELCDRLGVADNASAIGNYLGSQLTEMKSRYEFIKDVRWRGLMIGIEFGEPHAFGLKAGWKLAHGMDRSLFPQAVTMPLLEDHGVLTQVSGHHVDIIKLIPPLTLSREDADWFLDAFDQVMQTLHRFPGPVWESLSRIGRHAVRGRAERRNRSSARAGARARTPSNLPS